MFAPAAIAVTRLIAIARRRANPGLADLTWVVPAAGYGLVEVAVHFVVKGEFPLLANSSRNLTVPFTALVDALKYDAAHINTAHLSPIDISLLEYATLAIFILAGLAVLVRHHRARARAPRVRLLRAPARPAVQPDLDQHVRRRALAHRALPDGAGAAGGHAAAVPELALSRA